MNDTKNRTAPPAETAAPPKEKKPRKSSIPDGHQKVEFHMKNDEHAIFAAAADKEDRSVNDFARVLARKAARNHEQASGAGSAGGGSQGR